MTEDSVAESPEVSASTPPESRAPKVNILKVPWFWAGACALSIAGSTIAITSVNQTYFGPEKQVSQYFELLQSGRSDRALGLLKAKVPAGDAVLLSGEPFKASLKGLDTSNLDFVTAGSASDPDQRTVTATYKMESTEQQTTFTLQKTRSDWLFFDHWEFVPVTLPTATVQAQYSPQVDVNGSASPLTADGGKPKDGGPAWKAQSYPVLPPAMVNASYETKFIKGPQQQQAITSFDQAAPKISLGAEASDSLSDYIDAQLKSYLDECASRQVLKPAGCPMNYDTNARVRSSTIKWEILQYPEAEVTLTPKGWEVERLHGRAKIALEEQDLDSGERATVQEEDPFEFSAAVTVNGNRVTVTPDAFDYDPNNKT
ncbi:hypothetical protein [Neomicrococcus lactis]|uniref:hypothetical protein n=1 Tax=Neomicrococcus lactis TaxID=732241 RepID=UPI002301B6F9|nr:hypothetical protein [Neomicrococcus lactis]